MFVTGDSLSPAMTAGEERMETPGDVAVMLRLAELGWAGEFRPCISQQRWRSWRPKYFLHWPDFSSDPAMIDTFRCHCRVK